MSWNVANNIVFFVAGFLLVALFYVSIDPSTTSFIVYEQSTRSWDLSNPADYSLSSSINLSSGARLSVSTQTTSYSAHTTNRAEITAALKVEDDNGTDNVFSKVSALDGTWQNIGKDGFLNVTFSHELASGSNMSFYIDPNKEGALRVCSNLSCSSVLGTVSHGKVKAWFTLQLSPSQPLSILFFDPGESTKFDYIYANYTGAYNYTISTNSFAVSGSVETADVAPASLSSWGFFSATNASGIAYSYSTDSGQSWAGIASYAALSSASVSSGKIRFRATLSGNGNRTPALSSMSVNYSTIKCTERWVLYQGPCLVNDRRLRTYSDSNDCGTGDGIPADNSTYVSCDYCTPSWGCSSFAGCGKDNVSQCISVNDSVGCFGITGLAGDSFNSSLSSYARPCAYDYAPPTIAGYSAAVSESNLTVAVNFSDESEIHSAYLIIKDPDSRSAVTRSHSWVSEKQYVFSIGSGFLVEGMNIVLINVTDLKGNSAQYKREPVVFTKAGSELAKKQIWKNDTMSIPEKRINVSFSMGSSANGTVYVAAYNESTRNASPPSSELKKYVEIVASDEAKIGITSATIRVEYNDSELQAANIDESTLAIYFYNETLGMWVRESSFVNTSANYIEAIVNHTSLFGVFGDQPPSQQQSGSSGSSGSSGGGGSTYTGPSSGSGSGSGSVSGSASPQPKKIPEKKPVQEVKQPLIPQEIPMPVKCTYSLFAGIPEVVSFVENSTFSAALQSTGSCSFDDANVVLSDPVNSVVNISYLPGSRAISMQAIQLNRTISTRLEGFAVKDQQRKLKNYTGKATIAAVVNGSVVATQEIPFTAMVAEYEPVEKARFPMMAAIIAGFIAGIGLLVFLRVRKSAA